MARRVFLHVGPPKTGTSFLQEVWWHNRRAMAEQGLLFPGNRMLSHFWAAAVIFERDWLTERLSPRQLRAWEQLLTEIGEYAGDALISTERFASATAEQAARAVADLHRVAEEVHVVATVRDLARQVPSSWQQRVKRGGREPLDEWWRLVATHDDHPFWLHHDVADVLDRWSRDLPPEHVHLVVHGRPGTPPGQLLERACRVVGVDAHTLEPTGRDNESLGAAHVELLRRVNTQLPEDRDLLGMARLTKGFFTRRMLLPAGESDRFDLPPEAHAWATQRGTAMVEQLRARSYDVVGDLDDLVPDPQPRGGRDHSLVSDTEVAELASSVIARMLVHQLSAGEELVRLRRTVRRQRRTVRRLRRSTRTAPARRRVVPRLAAGVRRLRTGLPRR